MLCVIPHINENKLLNANEEHMKKANFFIKTLFCWISDDEMNDTFDTFWSDYTEFNYNNGPFDDDYFICSNKDILEGNSHIQYQKYSLPCTNVLGFVACRVTSKILIISGVKRFWRDFKKIKYVKISATSSDVPEKQSIVYTYACIESVA